MCTLYSPIYCHQGNTVNIHDYTLTSLVFVNIASLNDIILLRYMMRSSTLQY